MEILNVVTVKNLKKPKQNAMKGYSGCDWSAEDAYFKGS
jgi:hypothetical protein